MPNWTVTRVGIEIILDSVLGSKLTWFCVGDRSWLGFSVSMEIDMVLVMVVEIDLIPVWGIELDLISV